MCGSGWTLIEHHEAELALDKIAADYVRWQYDHVLRDCRHLVDAVEWMDRPLEKVLVQRTTPEHHSSATRQLQRW